jgi:hypothetical protein
VNYGWHDLAGNVGVGMIIVTYLLLQLGRLDGRSLTYSMLNAVGASLVLLSLAYDFNLSAFVIELFWVLISLIGIFRHLAKPRERES